MGYYDYCFKVRGKCNIARQIFAQAALAPEYALNQGYPGGINKYGGIFSSLLEPREYDINNVYIAGSSRGGNAFYLTPGDILPLKGVPPVFITQDNPTIYTMKGASLLRGYLQPMTLAEFCTAQNLEQRATRTYIETFNNNTADYNANLTAILDADKRAVNEFAAYANKIVPVITWYYTNSDNERVSDRQSISISYIYTANKSNTSRWEQVTVPLSGGWEYKRIIEPYNFPTAHYAISAPYVSSLTSVHESGEGVPLNGYIYCTKSGDDMRITATQTDNPIYTLLSVGYSDIAGTSTSDYYPITDGIFAGKYGAEWKRLFMDNAKTIPVFNSVDDIIKLFDDFGVVVTTDWDEVLSPVPTPEEISEINPDPTDREIPNFPDNTTDITPIEATYITPSTFAQSCVYTPTTTRDFLRWICNNTVDIGNWSRLFANPVDVVTGINLYNLDIVAHDSGRTKYNEQTNIIGVTTDIPNYSINDGYNNIIDGGTLHLTAYYGNYADFTSMTYQMFIPFVGFTTLRACDVVNRTLHLYYAVDFATGAAVAFVNSDDKLIYTSPCTVAGKIPLSTSDKNSQMINNTLSMLGSVGGLLGGIASGNVGGGIGALFNGLGGLQMQTNYSNKGSLSAVNIYKLLPAFVERTRYDLFLPSNDSTYLEAKYQSYAGAPSTQFDTLLNCVNAGGFVQSDVVYLTSQTATETEKQQIIDLIKSGIYL